MPHLSNPHDFLSAGTSSSMSSSGENVTVFSSLPLTQIGGGKCGSVWGTLSTTHELYSHVPMVLKRQDASPDRCIKNETAIQSHVSAQAKHFTRTLVPRHLGFIEESWAAWTRLLPKLPGNQPPRRAMISEKIESISIAAQHFLIDHYCEKNLREFYKENTGQKHCLVRIYLGKRRKDDVDDYSFSRPSRFTLRNLCLQREHMDELGLPARSYALAMAEALATLHWKIRTDAAHVDFVLGSPRRLPDNTQPSNPSLAESPLWMLDFDRCRLIKADESCLDQIARSFWCNDPYFPQPGSTDPDDRLMWDIFAREYRRVGRHLVRAYPCRGEDPVRLCELVDSVPTAIEQTKWRWW